MSELLTNLGARVRTLREVRGQTQAELAATVGLSRTSITNLEAGRQGDVPATKLVAIAEALDVRVGMLLGEVAMPDIPVVRIITELTVECDRCGPVLDGIDEMAQAEAARRSHLEEHTR